MKSRRTIVTVSSLAVLCVLALAFWRPILFVGGGGLITLGHQLQEVVAGFKPPPGAETPREILDGVLAANAKSSWIRSRVHGIHRKPEVLAIMCIDPRLDARVVVGDSRDYYDVLRLPGSVLSEEAIESIELSVREHDVKVVLFTTHTDCAMEAVAESEGAANYPALSRAVERREVMFQRLLDRPLIADRIAKGELLIERFVIDTENDRLLPEGSAEHAARRTHAP